MASFRGTTNYNLSGLSFLGSVYPVVDWTYKVKDNEIEVKAALSLEWSGLTFQAGVGEFTISIRALGVDSEEESEVIEKEISKPIGYTVLEIGTAEATFTFSKESVPEIEIEATGSMTDSNTNESVFEIVECYKNVGQLVGNDLILHFPESNSGELRRETVVGGALKVEGQTTLNDALVVYGGKEDSSSLALELYGKTRLTGSVEMEYEEGDGPTLQNPWILDVRGPVRISTVNVGASYALSVFGNTLFSQNLSVSGDLTLGGCLEGGRVRLYNGSLTAGNTVTLSDDLWNYRFVKFKAGTYVTYPLSTVYSGTSHIRAIGSFAGEEHIEIQAIRGTYTKPSDIPTFKLDMMKSFSISTSGITNNATYTNITEIWGIK